MTEHLRHKETRGYAVTHKEYVKKESDLSHDLNDIRDLADWTDASTE